MVSAASGKWENYCLVSAHMPMAVFFFVKLIAGCVIILDS
jgi:hypothetical protein